MLYSTEITFLYASVVRVLAYYALFKYPLRSDEIYLFLPEGGISRYEFERGLAELVDEGRVKRSQGLYYLPEHDSDIVERRLQMEEEGRKMWRIARLVASLMRLVPFVRGVFISGQLCRYIADRDSDIDYFIVTSPDRLWIVRTIFVMIRRTLLFNSRKYFCTNYYVTTENMEIKERNAYVACEVASLKPIYNRDLFETFLRQNQWITEHYPNFSIDQVEIRKGAAEGSGIRGFLEMLFPKRLTDRLDIRLMNGTRIFWRKKFAGRSPETYETSLRSRRDESRAHPQDRSSELLTLYRDSLRSYGIIDD